MFTSHIAKPASTSLLKRLAASAAALALVLLSHTVSTPAKASDLDFSNLGAGQTDDSHFLRIGLYKSAVIKLPVPVKDVIVGDPSVVDVVIRNKTTAYLFGRTAAQTNVFFFDANGNQILSMDIDVTMDTKALQKLIERTIPGSQIKVDTAGANVVLKGTAQNATEAALAESLAAKMAPGDNTVVNAIKLAEGDQVMLKVKVVEVKRDVLKSFGINLDTFFSVGNVTGAFTTTNPVLGSALQGVLGYASDNFSIDAAIQALESQSLIKTLAEPNLTAVSGQKAQFLAGGQYPYISGISCDSNNTNCVNTVTYKDYGVKLGFTPTVLSEGRISLKIATEVSELDDVTTGALKTRAAETTIELPSGGAMMLAGLIKEDTAQDITGTPGLMNLPILGTLFRSRNFTSGQTELAVIVVPYIVGPVAEKQLASPDDRLANPSDGGQIFWGKLNRMYGTAGNHPNGVYHGKVGYIIE
jgi:pilus assembly protein CpaC